MHLTNIDAFTEIGDEHDSADRGWGESVDHQEEPIFGLERRSGTNAHLEPR